MVYQDTYQGKKKEEIKMGALLVRNSGRIERVFPKNEKGFSQKDCTSILGGEFYVVPIANPYLMFVKKEIVKDAVPNRIATEKFKEVGGDKPIFGDVIISDNSLME